MPSVVDSHCHLNRLNLDKYDGDLSAAVQAAHDAGVEHILNVCIDLETAGEVIALAEKYEHVTASVGLHPSDKADVEPTVEALKALASHPKVVAIGETGLDYYYNDSGLDLMRERFRVHIRAARELNKPLIIHTRDARDDTIRIMQEEHANECRGVMHCFTESVEMADQAIALGFYISFSGIVTFKNAKNVQAVAEHVPLERMLIETDAPYLTPMPYRGKPNEPAYVQYVAEKIAALKNVPVEEVAAQTTRNFYELFLT